MESYPNLNADIVILPHHGSTNNLDTRFVEHLTPSVVIASCSKRTLENAYRPSKESPVRAFYTAADGAVTLKIKADGTFSATGFRNP